MLAQEKDLFRQELERIKVESQDTISQLEEENKKYLEKIIKMSKHSAESSVPSLAPQKKEIRDVNPYNNIKTFTKSAVIPTMRELSFKQTKDFIDEIYVSKSKFDQKCNEGRQALETLQQYMMTYLITKYGLKSLANEWLAALDKAIPKYSYDIDVLLFGKTLRNEVNEDFNIVFKQVREASVEVLRQYFKTKQPFTPEKSLKLLVEQKKNAELDEEEWAIIVRTLHEVQDQEEVFKVVVQKIWDNNLSANPRKKKLIHFNDLMQILLEFQLNSHEEFLRPILPIIRQHEYNGTLNHESFKELMLELSLETEKTRYLKMLDPNNTNVITISTLLSLFSTVRNMQESIEGEVVLHRLYNELNSEIE